MTLCALQRHQRACVGMNDGLFRSRCAAVALAFSARWCLLAITLTARAATFGIRSPQEVTVALNQVRECFAFKNFARCSRIATRFLFFPSPVQITLNVCAIFDPRAHLLLFSIPFSIHHAHHQAYNIMTAPGAALRSPHQSTIYLGTITLARPNCRRSDDVSALHSELIYLMVHRTAHPVSTTSFQALHVRHERWRGHG